MRQRVGSSTSCSAALGFYSNFQLVEQLSVHWETSKFLCLNNHSHAPATSYTIKKCRKQLVSRMYLSNLLALLLGSTFFYEKVSLRNKKLY